MAAAIANLTALQAGACTKLQSVARSTSSNGSMQSSLFLAPSLYCQPAHRLGARCQATKPSTSEPATSSEKAENGSAATPAQGLNLNFIPPPDAPEGSFAEVMAFSGPAPEVINGRIAMWGFLYATIGELSQGETIGQQFLSHPVSVISTALILSLASFIPTLISDVSFGELLETASASGMPPQLKVFNYPVEKWTGRVAMLAFVSFLVIEAVSGQATFSLLKTSAGL